MAPRGWGGDQLTDLMERAHQNRFATFQNKPEFQRLIAINDCFHKASDKWTNPTNPVAALLLIRSHAAFFAACEKATSSALADTFPHIRTCLEYAAYALHVEVTPGLTERWLRRHENEAAKTAVIRAFAVGNLRASIKKKDRHTEAVFSRLYEDSIDFGAHPNERSVSGSLAIREAADGDREVEQLWFHGDGQTLDYLLRTTSQAGICALQILQNVFPGRFELLGINSRILELRQGL